MLIDVRPRYVAAPWDPETSSRIVGLEDYVEPERGPLELYLSVFDFRAVRWDRHYQSFAIYQENPGEAPILVERLTYWDSAPDPVTGLELDDEQIAAMAGRDASIVRRFMPFDYHFVARRLKGRYEILHDGADKHRQRILERNLQRSRTKRRDQVRNMAASLNEVKNWLGVLTEYEQTGRMHVGGRTARVAGCRESELVTAAPAAPPQLILASR